MQRLAILLIAVALVAGACGPTTGPAEARGIVFVDRDGIYGWLGADPGAPTLVGIPNDPGHDVMFDIDASVDGRLVVVSGLDTVNVSGPIASTEAAPQPAWTTLPVREGIRKEEVPGVYRFPAWDPTGTRIAFVVTPELGAQATPTSSDPASVVVVDAATGSVITRAVFEGSRIPRHLLWVGSTALAVQMWDDVANDPAPYELLVDARSGAISTGPGALAWAASPDTLRLLADPGPWPANGPMQVQETSDWLAGGPTALGTLAKPTEDGVSMAYAFGPLGDRVVIAWGTGGAETMSEHVFTASSGWKEVASTPERDSKMTREVTWLP